MVQFVEYLASKLRLTSNPDTNLPSVVLPQAILKGHLQDCWRRLRALRQPPVRQPERSLYHLGWCQ